MIITLITLITLETQNPKNLIFWCVFENDFLGLEQEFLGLEQDYQVVMGEWVQGG